MCVYNVYITFRIQNKVQPKHLQAIQQAPSNCEAMAADEESARLRNILRSEFNFRLFPSETTRTSREWEFSTNKNRWRRRSVGCDGVKEDWNNFLLKAAHTNCMFVADFFCIRSLARSSCNHPPMSICLAVCFFCTISSFLRRKTGN